MRSDSPRRSASPEPLNTDTHSNSSVASTRGGGVRGLTRQVEVRGQGITRQGWKRDSRTPSRRGRGRGIRAQRGVVGSNRGVPCNSVISAAQRERRECMIPS